ncbi:hypothetical protein OG558_12760 [Kribbella sp. NBC_01510]|uniref:hypothetical protein n=1 Tax=Kribbella sp. NBC_01510 TaxID=2903581 RepID=UPI003869CC75
MTTNSNTDQAADNSLVRAPKASHTPHRTHTWPVLLLALPAFVAIWSGWVGLGQMTEFGVVHPLPGILDSFSINTAITLPIGVETYAAFALRVWLAGRGPVRARRFAKHSAIGALVLGALGQVAYHLLEAAGITRAPWWITTVVACLPVGVLGAGAALAHLMRADHDPVQVADLEQVDQPEHTPDSPLSPSLADPDSGQDKPTTPSLFGPDKPTDSTPDKPTDSPDKGTDSTPNKARTTRRTSTRKTPDKTTRTRRPSLTDDQIITAIRAAESDAGQELSVSKLSTVVGAGKPTITRLLDQARRPDLHAVGE